MNTQTALFPLGQCLMTRAVAALADEGAVNPFELLARHVAGDWGDLDALDRRANDHALLTGARLFSSYCLDETLTVWAITEAVGDDGQRMATTLLLPDEY